MRASATYPLRSKKAHCSVLSPTSLRLCPRAQFFILQVPFNAPVTPIPHVCCGLHTGNLLGGSSQKERIRTLVIASQVYLPFDGSVLRVVNRPNVDSSITKRSMEVPLAATREDAAMVRELSP
jgi:hypothetical protein